MNRRIQDVSSGRTYGASIDNKKPFSFKLAKKLTTNRHPNQHAVVEHVKNMASL